MEKGKIIKIGKIVISCLIVFLFLWFLIIYPLGKFNQNENIMKAGAKRYFELNSSKLPKEGDVATVGLDKLYSKNYVDALYIPYTSNLCSTEESWVKVKKEKGEYKYYTYLLCGVLSSNVDHHGPNIVLNGKDKIVLDLNSNYKELGVKSVVDNTDGKIDVSKVQINSSGVDTSKIGTYKVKYLISDSFKNQTVKERTVVVKKTLSSIVKNDTNNGSIYKGDVSNNYIRFANTLFRIARINGDNSVTIISDSPLAYVDYTGLDKWLNDYYYSLIPDASKKFLTNNVWCNDRLNEGEVTKIANCKDTTKKKVSVLTASDYNASLVDEYSYLNNGSSFWIDNTADDANSYVIDEGYRKEAITNIAGIKPVLRLKKGIDITDGDGTADNPYTIEDITPAKAGTAVNKRYTGEYIIDDGAMYRIIKADEDDDTKIIAEFDLANENGYPVTAFYTKEPYQYNPKSSGNIGYEINNEMGSYIKTDNLVNHEIEVPLYKKNALYGKEVKINKYKVKLSVPNMYEIYSAPTVTTYAGNCWFINSSQDNGYHYYLDEINEMKYDEKIGSGSARVRVVGYLNKKCTILSGTGTSEDPYKITK